MEQEEHAYTALRLLHTYPETIVDGEGLRYAIYLAGCTHRCPGCQNVRSWNPEAGTPLTVGLVDRMVAEIRSNPLLDGITFSGGDPFFNPVAFVSLLRRMTRETGLPVWCYTGYTYEEICSDGCKSAALPYINVLVDGRFVESLYDPHLSFRGSRNQRIIRLG